MFPGSFGLLPCLHQTVHVWVLIIGDVLAELCIEVISDWRSLVCTVSDLVLRELKV